MQEPKRFLGLWTSGRDALAGIAGLAGAGLVLALGGWQLIPGAGNFFGGEGMKPAPCQPRLGQPLTAPDVVEAFRAEGFSMRSLAESKYCDGNVVPGSSATWSTVADVTNDEPEATEYSEEVKSQGWATCDVSLGPPKDETLHADLDASADSPIFGGRKAEFRVANVSCRLYPQRDDDQQIARAHAAMKRLARQLTER